MTNKKQTLLLLSSAILIVACASPTVVQSVKPGDQGLSCSQLQNEYADAERFRSAAEAEKTVTGGNVARALLFWPAILGTAANANEAISAADSRKVHLANQMSQKNCAIPVTGQVTVVGSNSPEANQSAQVAGVVVPPVQASAPPVQSQEDRLRELKRLHDTNLISKEVYLERQKAILGTL